MRKYIEIFKVSWNEILAYRFDVFSDALLSVARIVFAYLLWSAIFRTNSMFGGFTFNMMITYYILINFLSKLDKSEDMAEQFSREIGNGQFTKYITRPVNVLGYFFSNSLSKSGYLLIINLIGTAAWIFIFQKSFVLPENPVIIVWAIIILLLGLVFLLLFNYFLSILTFWFLNVSGFFLFKRNLIEIFTGTLIPLSLFPGVVVQVFKLLPFYYVYYFPVSLYLNKNTGDIVSGIFVLFFWIIAILLLDIFIYRRAIKRYDGVGI